MDFRDILERTFGTHILATDASYYRYIFKKTEKIVCSVFYVLRSLPNSIRQDDGLIKDTEQTAQRTLSVSLRSLYTPREHSSESVQEMMHVLIELESKLRILSAARLLPADLLGVFIEEIDAVMRGLRNYSTPLAANPILEERDEQKQQRRGTATSRERIRIGSLPAASYDERGTPNRRDRIVTILKDKGQATIKDVSEFVTDCSEKTLQRELNHLIKDGVVMREGERRWSKYSLL